MLETKTTSKTRHDRVGMLLHWDQFEKSGMNRMDEWYAHKVEENDVALPVANTCYVI